MQKNIAPFIQTQKTKQLMKAILMKQSIVRLYETYKNLFEKIWLDQ